MTPTCRDVFLPFSNDDLIGGIIESHQVDRVVAENCESVSENSVLAI